MCQPPPKTGADDASTKPEPTVVPPVTACEHAVKVEELDFAYPSSLPTEEERLVLRGFNMQLAPGSRCLLLGANGSGKSTLLKVLAGKHLTSGDRVKAAGRAEPATPRRASSGSAHLGTTSSQRQPSPRPRNDGAFRSWARTPSGTCR